MPFFLHRDNIIRKLKDNEMLLGEHEGGCLLFEKEDDVKALLGLN
ncbi:hypothetical protein [Clostridium sp.]|nr:hypothetical protein [Clostridium sp.]